jgi:cation transport regulator
VRVAWRARWGTERLIERAYLEKEDGTMPYEKLTDLPDSVRDNLPKHAQEIYRAAYNSAEEQYDEEDRRHRVAWSAVEQKYEKNEEGEWVEKEED